jgi:peptidoglycan hydrolase-like protein with peptidoglycan-binding domain
LSSVPAPVSSVAPGSASTTPIDPAAQARRAVEAFVGLPHGTTRGSTIDALQRALNVFGARPALGTDGVYGRGTEAAVRDFLERDLPELSLGSGIGEKAASRADVKRLQRALNIVTGSRLEVDGGFGKGTEAALVAWQKSLGVNNPSPEGTLDRAGWNALLRAVVTTLDTGVPRVAPPPSAPPSAPGPIDALQPPASSGVRTNGSAALTNNVQNNRRVASKATFGGVPIRGLGQWYLDGRGTAFGGKLDPDDDGVGAFGYRTGTGGREGVAVPQRVMAELTGTNDKSVHQQYRVEVLNRKTGKREIFDIVDRGPGQSIWREHGRAVLDLTEGAVAEIGGEVVKNRKGHMIADRGLEDLAFRIIKR